MQGLLSEADALSASGQGTGPGTAVSADRPYSAGSYGPHPSGSFYIRGGEGGQGASASSSNNQDNDLFVDRLVEVKICYEFGSSDKIVNVKGKLEYHQLADAI